MKNKDCDLCELCRSATHNVCVWGRGRKRCPIMLVGEAPGYVEDLEDTPFRGEAGHLLDHVIKKLGVSPDLFYITNVLRCRPSDNKLPPKKRLKVCLDACRPYLMEEIKSVKPRVIVLLGKTALFALTGHDMITKFEGMEVRPECEPDCGLTKTKLVAAFHPAYVLRSPSRESRLAAALDWACTLAGIHTSAKTWEEVGPYAYDIRS